jgi:hypothetical protein
MRKRPIARLTLIAILAGCPGLLAGSAARAGDDKPWEVHIAQIDPQAATADARGRIAVSQTEAMHLDPRIASMARMADRLSSSTVVQRGNGNTAVSNTRGTGNITGQFQTGSGNFSGIGVDGFSNKVVTFQNGDKAYSSIDVIGGNKTIYDMQFGTTQRVKELPFTGTNKEKYLIIDKGQYGAYIARVK